MNTTRPLLACGAVAGPLFIGVALLQAFTRAGFDLNDHPLSLLSLGDLGWVQITNFVAAGLLFLVSAVGMRRVLQGSRGGTWGPRLVGAFGLSLVAGGIFVADPAYGFPPGTPAGAPDGMSWHGILHGIAPVVGFLALIVACFVFARRFAALRYWGWAGACATTGVVVLVLSVWPNLGGDPAGRFGPLWVALVLGFGWVSALAAQLMTAPSGGEVAGRQRAQVATQQQ